MTPGVLGCFNASAVLELRRKALVEAFPDLSKLSDADLKKLIDELEAEENEISYRRRMLHGKIDMLRAELVARMKHKGEGELGQVDLDRLAEILASKSAPMDVAGGS